MTFRVVSPTLAYTYQPGDFTMVPNQIVRAEPPPHSRSLIFSGLVVGLAIAASVAATPNLEFSPNSVRAVSVTPRGCSVFFSVSHEKAPWTARVVPRVEPLVDEDGDGVIDYFPGTDLVEKSIWAVVDATSGDVAVSAPTGYEPQEILADSYALFPSGKKFVDAREQLDLLIVRPGVGAWHSRLHDGGTGDTGLGSDGQVIAAVDAMDLIWSATAKLPLLTSVQGGDIVIGIDPIAMVFYRLEIGLASGS